MCHDEVKVTLWRHIWLYAKGHYARSERSLDDLQTLVGHHTTSDPQYVDEAGILQVLLHLALPRLLGGSSPSYSFQQLFERLMAVTKEKGSPLTAEHIAGELLAIIACAPVIGKDGSPLMNLGDPNPSLLPLSTQEA